VVYINSCSKYKYCISGNSCSQIVTGVTWDVALYEGTNVFNFNGYKNSNFLDCTVIFKWFLPTHKIWFSLYFTDSKLSMSCVACSGEGTMAIKKQSHWAMRQTPHWHISWWITSGRIVWAAAPSQPWCLHLAQIYGSLILSSEGRIHGRHKAKGLSSRWDGHLATWCHSL